VIEEKRFRIIGSTHIDLAWKKDREEMGELFESFIVRLLDLLDSHPSFTYVIEQAAHLRRLARGRPDLIQRLGAHIRDGRIEVVGGMASTMETNIPNGESFVRNQLLGMKWFAQNLGARPRAGWLIDTFGINAQVPQILRQMGISYLFANRFGGVVDVTMFRARGLDGSQVPVIGRDVYAPFIRPGNLHFRHVQTWQEIDALFEAAAATEGNDPVLVMPYTENETLPSLGVIRNVEKMNGRRQGGQWEFSLPSRILEEIESASRGWRVIDGDLNPEFTGTYSQRSIIRRRNREVEAQLLDAEKWLSLLGAAGWQTDLDDCWWKMAFTHFHDVFTGSHPTRVLDQVLSTFDDVQRTVDSHVSPLLDLQCPTDASREGYSLFALNSLPWARTETFRFLLPDGIGAVKGIFHAEREIPFEQAGKEVRARAELPPMGQAVFRVEVGATERPPEVEETGFARIVNGRCAVELDAHTGLSRISLLTRGGEIEVASGCLLVAQHDEGSFQIERPEGSEIPATSGSIRFFALHSSPTGQRVILRGAFPELPWSPGSFLSWEAEYELPKDGARVDLKLTVRWNGERTRIRLKLQTPIDSSECINEVPFGVVRRRPYREQGTARGEWPVQRFAALEDGQKGLALVNTGVCGVEARGGAIWTTLLRAPATEYAGMVPDDTSSQHGNHVFRFSLVPYAGCWHEAEVHKAAAEVNAPPLCLLKKGSPRKAGISQLARLDAATVMMSALKGSDDGTGDLVVRLYETAGKADRALLFVDRADRAWESTLEEVRGADLECAGGVVRLDMKPFEIRTVRVHRNAGSLKGG
jgi:alpha-mannosidase